MKCVDAVELILEADPQDLAGKGDSILARHVRSCPKCRALALVVLEEERALAVQMVEAVPAPDLDAILALGLASENRPSSRHARKFRSAGYALIPLAAAAALVGLLLQSEPTLPGPAYSSPEPTVALGLEIPEGRNAAVLRTDNPDITVLWFF
jgi:predicted anti-sigma-YlaC factor YlaD